MATLDARRDDLAEGAELPAHIGVEFAVGELHQARIASDLPEPRERRKDLDLRFAHALLLDVAHDALPHLAEDLLVEDGLLVAKRDDDLLLDLLGEVCRDVLFEPAEDEGLDDLTELLRGLIIAAIDRPRIILFKALEPAEEPRRDEIEDAPDLAQAVFDGRTCEREPALGLEAFCGPRGLAHRVLNMLRLIEDRVAEIKLSEQLFIAP